MDSGGLWDNWELWGNFGGLGIWDPSINLGALVVLLFGLGSSLGVGDRILRWGNLGNARDLRELGGLLGSTSDDMRDLKTVTDLENLRTWGMGLGGTRLHLVGFRGRNLGQT